MPGNEEAGALDKKGFLIAFILVATLTTTVYAITFFTHTLLPPSISPPIVQSNCSSSDLTPFPNSITGPSSSGGRLLYTCPNGVAAFTAREGSVRAVVDDLNGYAMVTITLHGPPAQEPCEIIGSLAIQPYGTIFPFGLNPSQPQPGDYDYCVSYNSVPESGFQPIRVTWESV